MKGRTGQNFWWVAPVFGQTKIAWRRLKLMLPRDLFVSNETELTVRLANGAVVWFRSGERPDTLFGEDVFAAVLDEASRMREEAWHAVRSTLTATQGPVRLIGNVRGRRNWFWRGCRRAEAGEPGHAWARITAADAIAAGVLSADEVAAARRDLPEAVWQELFEAVAADDQSNPFGAAAIAACVAPLSSLPPVAFGWDLAKSQDWTVGVGLDRGGRVSVLARFQAPWHVTLDRITQLTQSTPALVDSTGVGDAIVEELQRRDGMRLEGFRFSSQSKQRLMEGLALAIQRQEVRFPDGVIRAELESFEFVYGRHGVTYSAPAGAHDDAVCALALAVMQWRQVAQRSEMRIRSV